MSKIWGNRKSRFLLVLLAGIICFTDSSEAQGQADTNSINYLYKQNYYFITMPDTIFTFESEFVLPDGFRHADSSELTDFQNYVANFPLWNRFLPVGNWKKQIQLTRDQISRPVHLPHSGTAMTDKAIPVRILAEYLHDRDREFDLKVVPNAGDTMTYSIWLIRDLVYGPGKSVGFRRGIPKDTTLNEYYTFMRFCMENTSYKSLENNCDSIRAKDLKPGDLFIAHNDNGKKGVTFVIMHMLVNEKNQKLYAVATGCEKACDFHIPLFNNDKNNPWLTSEQITQLKQDFSHSGFFRLKIH